MSLINQMLQELDARRSEVSGGTAFGQQIRAVPERRGVHPAWWVALGLGLVLVGVVAFFLLRPAPDVAQMPGAQLPLKLDVDLGGAGSPLTSAQPPSTASTVEIAPPVPAEAVPAPAASPALIETKPVPKTNAQPEAGNEPSQPKLQTRAETVSMASRSAPIPKAHEAAAAPLVVNKQVKELTPPQRAENEYRKAMLALQQGRRSEASSGLELALQLDPKNSGARHALIGILLDGKQQDEAIQRAREGLDADLAQPALAMILARLQLEKGELRPAIDTLERSLTHASDKADYQAFLAALLQRDGRHKQAVEQYLLALQKVPENGVWWMGLGISLQAERRVSEAVESFKRAKSTNALSPELIAFVDARLGQLQQ